ncbi:MAG: Transcriptional regulatory protein ZraR [Xylophilus sp.]|nr:MAG: Transcriptional regulatory protein ZraR [Xylophilus sp.]
MRELRNAVQRAHVMADHRTIDDRWLPRDIPGAPPVSDSDAAVVTLPIGIPLAQAERQLILATLAHFRNHKERTAAALGISLKTLYNRLKEYEETAPQPVLAEPPAAG